MRNRILEITRNIIPYVKELRAITGSVVGCLVMQQLDYWFATHPDGFWKFLEPCEHDQYTPGDSWTEELGLSPEAFTTAFDRIGVRYKSLTEYRDAAEPFYKNGRPYPYCSCFDRRTGLTQYYRNHQLVDRLLDDLIHGKPLSAVSGNRGERSLETADSGILYNTDTTTENTAETTRTTPHTPEARSVHNNGTLTPAPTSAIIPAPPQLPAPAPPVSAALALPDFVMMGKKHPTAQGSTAPDSVQVTDNALAWAQTQGWRAGLVELQQAVDTCLDYWKGNGKRKLDWPAVFRNWIRRAVTEGDDLKLAAALAARSHGGSGEAPNVQRTGSYGNERYGQQNSRANQYGFDHTGQPTNKATKLRAASADLASYQAERRRAYTLSGEVGVDADAQRENDGGSG